MLSGLMASPSHVSRPRAIADGVSGPPGADVKRLIWQNQHAPRFFVLGPVTFRHPGLRWRASARLGMPMRHRIASKQPREISAAEAAALVRSGDWLDYGSTVVQPDVFDHALAARTSELRDVKIRSCISMRPRAVLEADPDGEHFQWFSWHFSAYDRRKHDSRLCHYIPVNLGEIPDYYRRFLEPVDVAVIKTCPADADGWFNFSASSLWHRAAVESAKLVIVEVNNRLPYVL